MKIVAPSCFASRSDVSDACFPLAGEKCCFKVSGNILNALGAEEEMRVSLLLYCRLNGFH